MSSIQEETYRTIGKNVKKYRLASELSQEKLSEILDVNSKFIGHVERFERFISLKKLIEIAEYFNVPVKNFFE
ncbi:helix-turn-helix transcriptional regulator [bacterium]|nr:helix-turn-helix transcriptional regulator [bacterium]